MPPLHDIAHLAHVELLTHKPEESLDFFVRYLGLTENGSVYEKRGYDLPGRSIRLGVSFEW